MGWLRLAVGKGNDQHLQSFLGLLNWHLRPRGFGYPFAAGAYCWLRWGRTVGGVKQPAQGFPLKMLHSLATLTAVAAEPWQAPGGEVWHHLKAFGFGTDDRLTSSSIWLGDVIVCVDGARDAGSWRVGALIPGVGVRTHVAPQARYANQQTTEFRGLAWAVRFAVRKGHKSVTVCSDSEAAIAHVLHMRATSHLTHHQAVLRSLARVLWVSGNVVCLVWVPWARQPGDPMSRVVSVFQGLQARAEVEAWRTWDSLLSNLGEARVRGVVCLRGGYAPPPPQAMPGRQSLRSPCSTSLPHLCPNVGARVGPASGGLPVAPTKRAAMGDSVTADQWRPSSGGQQSGPPCSGAGCAAGWRTCPSARCCSATGCACAPSALSLPTGMDFWSARSGTWPHECEARRAAA